MYIIFWFCWFRIVFVVIVVLLVCLFLIINFCWLCFMGIIELIVISFVWRGLYIECWEIIFGVGDLINLYLEDEILFLLLIGLVRVFIIWFK